MEIRLNKNAVLHALPVVALTIIIITTTTIIIIQQLEEKQTIHQLPVHLLVLAQLCRVLSVSAAYYTDFPSTPTSRSPASTPDHSTVHTHTTVHVAASTPDHSTVHTHTTVHVALKHDRKMQRIICAPSCKVKTTTDHQTHRPI